MRRTLQFVLLGLFLFAGKAVVAQDKDCFQVYEEAFKERGAYTISDNIYRNVMISFFDGEEVYCVRAKVRVENGFITSIFFYYDDNTEELYEKKFNTLEGKSPRVINGISEMIINSDREKFKIVFIDKLKPKKKQLQRMIIPEDL